MADIGQSEADFTFFKADFWFFPVFPSLLSHDLNKISHNDHEIHDCHYSNASAVSWIGSKSDINILMMKYNDTYVFVCKEYDWILTVMKAHKNLCNN